MHPPMWSLELLSQAHEEDCLDFKTTFEGSNISWGHIQFSGISSPIFFIKWRDLQIGNELEAGTGPDINI